MTSGVIARLALSIGPRRLIASIHHRVLSDPRQDSVRFPSRSIECWQWINGVHLDRFGSFTLRLFRLGLAILTRETNRSIKFTNKASQVFIGNRDHCLSHLSLEKNRPFSCKNRKTNYSKLTEKYSVKETGFLTSSVIYRSGYFIIYYYYILYIYVLSLIPHII